MGLSRPCPIENIVSRPCPSRPAFFFFDVYAFRTPRKSYRFEYLRFVQLFKSLYLFLEKELEEKSTGEIEYLGEVQNFFGCAAAEEGKKRGICYRISITCIRRRPKRSITCIHRRSKRSKMSTFHNVHPPEVQNAPKVVQNLDSLSLQKWSENIPVCYKKIAALLPPVSAYDRLNSACRISSKLTLDPNHIANGEANGVQ